MCIRDRVSGEDRIDDQLAEARDREDLLGQHRAGQKRAELQRAQRDDRRQRVAHRVLEHHGPFVQPLGARGADIVAAERLQHRAAGMAHDHALSLIHI